MLMESSFLSEVDDTSILRTGLPIAPPLFSWLITGLSAHAPAQRAGAQRLRALAQLGRLRALPKVGRYLSYVRRDGTMIITTAFYPKPGWWGLFGRFRSWSNCRRDDHMVGTAALDPKQTVRSDSRPIGPPGSTLS